MAVLRGWVEAGIAASHPSHKNKGVARVGHPVAFVRCKGALMMMARTAVRQSTADY